MILIIDNYDSFTYNLVQAVGMLGVNAIRVARNDDATASELEALGPSAIIISPGPCTPRQAGISVEVVRRLAGRVPILGVCLGHQCIGAAYGARIVRMSRPMHGKTDEIIHDRRGVFAGLPTPLTVMRYHSLVIDEASLPAELCVTARSSSGEVMGVRHRRYPLEGVQFHPESYATPRGVDLLATFLRGAEDGRSRERSGLMERRCGAGVAEESRR